MDPVESQGHGVLAYSTLCIDTEIQFRRYFHNNGNILPTKRRWKTQFPKIVGKLITRKKNPEYESTSMVIQKFLAFHLKKL